MADGFQKEYKMITNKIYAVIPARSGSKSIKDKNIQDINGKPLIAYSILTAKSIPEIDRVIFSTDSIDYKKIAERYGAECLYLQPDSISRNDSGDIKWISYLLNWLKENENELPEFLIHLRPTSPLRDSKYISKAIQFMKQHPEATALRSVYEMGQTAYKHFEIEDGFLKSVGSGSFDLDDANKPRHLYPTTFDANGYVDILRTSYILGTGKTKIHGNKVIAFQVPYITDIDETKDLDYIRYEINHG